MEQSSREMADLSLIEHAHGNRHAPSISLSSGKRISGRRPLQPMTSVVGTLRRMRVWCVSNQGDRVDPSRQLDQRSWFIRRVKRHWYWARTQGFGRLIEEDELDPRDRFRRASDKRRWRKAHADVAPARPVYVVGVQRSGTNLVVRHLRDYPAVEAHNENSRAAFDRFQLKPDATISDLIRRSRHQFIVLKPLCDSHRTDDLLDGIESDTDARAIWVYRSFDARARSAVAKFGSSNRDVLAAGAAGAWDQTWQLSGVSPANRAFVESLDFTSMSAESGAALFWYLRNSLFFDLGLDQRDDVFLVSYDRLVANPDSGFASIDRFLELEDADPLESEEIRSLKQAAPLEIDPSVRQRCEALQQRLDEAATAQQLIPPSSTDPTGDQT